MTRKAWTVLAVAGGMILGCGGLLAALKQNQRLGEPGVKVVAVPLLDPAGLEVAPRTVYLPPEVAGYASRPLPMARIVLDWLPRDTTYGQRLYEAEDRFWIQVGAVLMGADRTSIHQPQYCLTGQGFRIESESKQSIRVGGETGFDLPVRRIVASGTFRGPDDKVVELRRVLVYWFVAAGETTADHEERMWRQAVEQLKTGVLQRWAYVTCFAPCAEGEEDEAYERIARFIARLAPDFLLQ